MLAIMGAIVAMSGCSLALSGPDPNRPVGQYPKCDTTKTLVGLDVTDGVGFGLGAVAVAGSSGQAAAVLGSISALWLLAAYHGNSVVNDCREQIALVESSTARPSASPDEDEAPHVAAPPSPGKRVPRARAREAEPAHESSADAPAAHDGAVEPAAPVSAAATPPPAAAAPARPATPPSPSPTKPATRPTPPSSPPPTKPATTTPPATPSPAQPAPPVQPAPGKPDDPWSAFWQEVP